MSKKRSGKKETMDPVLRQLVEIKRLLLFFLLKTGVKAGDLADVLGMDQGNFSRIMPSRKAKPYEWIVK